MIDPVITAQLTQSCTAFPVADLAIRQKRAIVSALRVAWAEVVASGAALTDEDTVTHHLLARLRALRGAETVPGFTPTTFETPIRDGLEMNFDGNVLEKKPDLTFRPAGEAEPMRAWFVEAKVIGPRHAVSLYERHGISRFERGDYAWAMPSGLMIAYNDASYGLVATLGRAVTLSPSPLDEAARESAHDRPFVYVGNAHGPGPITLVHLWFR